eukprot:scaffold285_cov330-Pavlova_lutheri.AAC.144
MALGSDSNGKPPLVPTPPTPREFLLPLPPFDEEGGSFFSLSTRGAKEFLLSGRGRGGDPRVRWEDPVRSNPKVSGSKWEPKGNPPTRDPFVPLYVSEIAQGVDMAVARPAAVRCRKKNGKKWKVCGGWIGTYKEGGEVVCIAHAAGIDSESNDGDEDLEFQVRNEGKNHPWRVAQLVETRNLHALVQEMEKCTLGRSCSGRIEWEFGWRTSKRANGNLNQAFRVAVLTVKWDDHEDRPPPFGQQISNECDTGTPFTVQCTPFDESSPLFAGSHLGGTLSNTWYTNDAAILYCLDIKALPGMEGSLMLDEKGKAMGMLMLPLQKRGSHVELPLATPILTLASTLPELFHGFSLSSRETTLEDPSSTVSRATDSVVLVAGTTFASGIVLGEKGWILSSAHAFPSTEAAEHPVQALSIRVQRTDTRGVPHFSWHRGVLFWKSVPSLDTALVKILNPPGCMKGIPFPLRDDYHVGKHVWVIGHAHFGSTLELPPSIYGGTISSIEEDAGGFPTVIQTTANIHPGCSGGALVDSDGRLVALVAGNSVHKTGRALPHLNFCVPFTLLRSIVNVAVSAIEDEQKMIQLMAAQQKWASYPSVFDLQRGKAMHEEQTAETDLPPALARFLKNNKFELRSKL